ncbi:MAG TPA: hypothetical protein PK797_05795 [Burkholderiaceae bacterium]|nr:hypothetical protein [Burkholderiaceae bacterium]
MDGWASAVWSMGDASMARECLEAPGSAAGDPGARAPLRRPEDAADVLD